MIRATKKGSEAIFSDIDWASGLPQRYGWTEKGQEALKTLPKEILDFVKPKPVEPKQITVKPKVVTPKQVIVEQEVKLETVLMEPITSKVDTDLKKKFAEAGAKSGAKVKQSKTKLNDNTKQKDRTPRVNKPRRVAKA